MKLSIFLKIKRNRLYEIIMVCLYYFLSKLRQDLLKAMNQGYSKDYQELIRKYFEQLQKTEKDDH